LIVVLGLLDVNFLGLKFVIICRVLFQSPFLIKNIFDSFGSQKLVTKRVFRIPIFTVVHCLERFKKLPLILILWNLLF